MDLHYVIEPHTESLEREFFLPSIPTGFEVVRHQPDLSNEEAAGETGCLKTCAIIREIEKNPDDGLMVWSGADLIYPGDWEPVRIKEAMAGFDLLFAKQSYRPEDHTSCFGFQVIRRNGANLEFYQKLRDTLAADPSADLQSAGNDLLGARGISRWGHLPVSPEAGDGERPGRQAQPRRFASLHGGRDPHGHADGGPENLGRVLTSLREVLLDFLGNADGERYLWMIDEAVWGEEQVLEDLLESMESCEADFLATEVRASFEDKDWTWWRDLTAPHGTILARGENMVAALLPLVRFSRVAARAVIDAVNAGWRGHPEALLPTVITHYGLVVEDIGGTGSFTPAGRRGLWYAHETWHWKGPVDRVAGMLHYPVPTQSRPLASGRLAAVPEHSGGPAPKILYVSPVGAASAELLPDVLKSFLEAGADCWLLQYQKADLPIPDGVRVICERGYKWQLAYRHLKPEAVAEYDYIFFWDDDLGVKDFDPRRFVRIMDTNRLAMAQPAIRSQHQLSHGITGQRACPVLWQDPDELPVVGRLTNFVEIMAPVFTRDAWREFHSYIGETNDSGWGYDYIPLGRKGIVDIMPVEHTRAVQSITDAAETDSRRFLVSQGLFHHAHVEMGWLFDPRK